MVLARSISMIDFPSLSIFYCVRCDDVKAVATEKQAAFAGIIRNWFDGRVVNNIIRLGLSFAALSFRRGYLTIGPRPLTPLK